jgi:hypothetical protein
MYNSGRSACVVWRECNYSGGRSASSGSGSACTGVMAIGV